MFALSIVVYILVIVTFALGAFELVIGDGVVVDVEVVVVVDSVVVVVAAHSEL